MPGANTLPIEFQIVFWMLFVFIGALCGLVVYWTKRYVDGQDKRVEKIEERFSAAVKTANDAADNLRAAGITVKFEFSEFRKEVRESHEEFRKEIGGMRSDLSQAMIRTLTVKDNIADIEKKTNAMVKQLNEEKTHVTDIHGKVELLDQNQTKILTVLKKLSDKLTLVTQKKDS